MASKTIDLVQKCIEPIVDKLGYSILEIEYAKKVDGMNLTITIDSPSGVNIEDCEKVHRAINDPLDELNPTNDGPYILSVSSPGIDRPIKSTSDFFRNEGKEVEVTLYSKINGKKNFKGLLKSFTDKIVEIEMDGEIVGFERSSVASITPVLLF